MADIHFAEIDDLDELVRAVAIAATVCHDEDDLEDLIEQGTNRLYELLDARLRTYYDGDDLDDEL